MTKIVVLVWMHKIITKTRVTGELALFMKSTVKTSRSNYPTDPELQYNITPPNTDQYNPKGWICLGQYPLVTHDPNMLKKVTGELSWEN